MSQPCGNMWRASATAAESKAILCEERKRRRDVGARQLKALGSTLAIERSKHLDSLIRKATGLK
jgi:hypothetical protein